jgi:amidase
MPELFQALAPAQKESLMDRPLWQWTATQVVAATSAGEVSCAEVTRSVLERQDATNPRLNAITLALGEQALETAAALDDAYARGETPGPLHGVPVTIKDNVDVRGQRTPNGLPALAGLIAPDDSPVTRNLLGAGAVLVGRTNTPEVSMRPTTNNPLFGLTRNPWADLLDDDVSSGGSSGGAGAAVASGMCAIGHGNDIGGSIRIPALHCGIPGLKPTQGRIPAFVPSASVERATVAALMSVQGPLARTVADVALGLEVMAGRDPRDPWWVPAPIAGPPVPRRAGVLRRVGQAATHPSVLAAIDRAAAALADDGYEVVELEESVTPGVQRAAELAFSLLMADLDHQLTPVLATAGSDEMRVYWDVVSRLGDRFPTVGDYVDGLARRSTLIREWLLFLDRYPVLVLPQLLGPLFGVDEDVRSPQDAAAAWGSLAPSIAVNVLGLPSALAPTGADPTDGRPTGVQLVGSRYREDVCLTAAAAVEAATGSLTERLWATG